MFDLEKRLIIMSPWTPALFLFLLEHIPAGPFGCASGTWGQDCYRYHHFFPPFLTGDLSSSTDWASTPTRILVLREHWRGDSKSRIIVFSQQHLTHKGEITWSHPLSSRVTEALPPLLDSLPEDRLTTFCGLKNLLSVEGLFVGRINHLPKPPSSPLQCLCEEP